MIIIKDLHTSAIIGVVDRTDLNRQCCSNNDSERQHDDGERSWTVVECVKIRVERREKEGSQYKILVLFNV